MGGHLGTEGKIINMGFERFSKFQVATVKFHQNYNGPVTQFTGIFVLDNDLMIPLTYHINCMGGITGNAPNA